MSGPFDLDLAPDSQGLFLGDYESLASTAGAFLPFYVQTDAGTQVRSDAFIAFPPPRAAASAATGPAQKERRDFVAVQAAAPPGAQWPPAAARQRVTERIRLTRAWRLQSP